MTSLDCGGQRSRSQQAVKVKSCEHHISCSTWAILTNVHGITISRLFVTWLYIEGQRSRSHCSIVWCQRHPHRLWCIKVYLLVCFNSLVFIYVTLGICCHDNMATNTCLKFPPLRQNTLVPIGSKLFHISLTDVPSFENSQVRWLIWVNVALCMSFTDQVMSVWSSSAAIRTWR